MDIQTGEQILGENYGEKERKNVNRREGETKAGDERAREKRIIIDVAEGQWRTRGGFGFPLGVKIWMIAMCLV